MPKRTDLKKIMIIGSGPIVIGQACEFDYSGTQGVKALKEEGYSIILVNSNPATIMTDPDLADQTYIEPLNLETITSIIKKERPCALLPTLGGQTALNLALELEKTGTLKKYHTELIGASADAIEKAESREKFRQAMKNIGLNVPNSSIAKNIEDVRQLSSKIPFPIIIRPAFTLGGTGGGIAYNMKDLEIIATEGLAASPTHEVMLEQSMIGWKEFEMEVIQDSTNNCIIVCSIENFDPMGVHTGDSITVAPAQTLTDLEYQNMRNASIAIMREIGVKTGGSNVQFGVNPKTGELIVIEMNPRVSRSSALASKATGFPIAKIAAKLAVGYTLDELRNDITYETSAAFEPTLDYCVIKIPKFTFEKFPGTQDELTTSMKSIGEIMAIGRTFKEALQKGIRSLETHTSNFTHLSTLDKESLVALLRNPNSQRIFAIRQALLKGISLEQIYQYTYIDPWFLRQIKEIINIEVKLYNFALSHTINAENPELKTILLYAKQLGLSDKQLADIWKWQESDIRNLRKMMDIKPTYYLVDTCAAEFNAHTPYFYSTYETERAPVHKKRKKIIILGGGPNRIGQGIEFDYCCCHASYALKRAGFEAIMVNSNPETVSTDYDTSDKLYFEPLTFEDVMNIVEYEEPDGVIIQFGGQTPLNLAIPLVHAGVPIIGTPPDAIDRAEDRARFQALLKKLSLKQPANGIAMSLEEACTITKNIGYPIVVRPSYVLGGRAMKIVYDQNELEAYFTMYIQNNFPKHPILIDQFLEHALEVDVDALADGTNVYVAGVMEHIEEAGIHSGDSSCVIPPYSLSPKIVEEIHRQTISLAKELQVIGLMNIQFAVKDNDIYILEVNPRASRTTPFVSKATGVPLPQLATRVMLGSDLKTLDPWSMKRSGYVSIKESVFPFHRFPGVDILLGPEMKSTGEVMGIAQTFEEAFLKAHCASGQKLPTSGKIFLSVNDKDKHFIPELARQYSLLGFELIATSGTASLLIKQNIPVTPVLKVYEGRPNIVDLIKNNEISLVINTASGKKTANDSKSIRQAALQHHIPYSTTIAGAKALMRTIQSTKNMRHIPVKSLQEYYKNTT